MWLVSIQQHCFQEEAGANTKSQIFLLVIVAAR